MRASSLRGVLLVLLAAGLWGTLGIFYKWGTGELGLTPLTIAFWRAALAALTLGLWLGAVLPLAQRSAVTLLVSKADLLLLAVYGLLGVTAFYLLYIYAVLLVGVAVAVVLLYTAPIFVMLMAWRFLGEGLGTRKVLALLLTLVGCVLVARAYDPTLLRLNLVGIACGLGAAFTYAFHSIFGKVALRRGLSIAVVSFYIYVAGAGGMLVLSVFAGPEQLLSMGLSWPVWGYLLFLALAQTVGAIYAYMEGLRHLEAGVASIIATFEPVVAALLAYFVLGETVEAPQLLDGGFILGAVLLLQIPGPRMLRLSSKRSRI